MYINHMSQSIYDQLREEYQGAPLVEDSVAKDPIAQFRIWFDAACKADISLANGMTLATVDEDGMPSARVVLLKHYDARGFVFVTNYESRKSRALEYTGKAALSFWWPMLSRQIRIEGSVERIEPEDSDAYFENRPRDSNLSAMASPQSDVVASRDVLSARVESTRSSWRERDLVRPAHWGGYRVIPAAVEFWQGRPNRLHDRLRYRRADPESGAPSGSRLGEQWLLERLAP